MCRCLWCAVYSTRSWISTFPLSVSWCWNNTKHNQWFKDSYLGYGSELSTSRLHVARTEEEGNPRMVGDQIKSSSVETYKHTERKQQHTVTGVSQLATQMERKQFQKQTNKKCSMKQRWKFSLAKQSFLIANQVRDSTYSTIVQLHVLSSSLAAILSPFAVKKKERHTSMMTCALPSSYQEYVLLILPGNNDVLQLAHSTCCGSGSRCSCRKKKIIEQGERESSDRKEG